MIRAIPRGWLSSHFKIFENDNEITELDFKNVGKQVSVEIQGETYEFKPRENHSSPGSYVIESSNAALAFAEFEESGKAFSFVSGGKEYLLRKDSTWARKFVLLENEQEVGAIYPKKKFSSTAEAELPDDIPLPIRIFMLWLVVSFWKQDEEDAALMSVMLSA